MQQPSKKSEAGDWLNNFVSSTAKKIELVLDKAVQPNRAVLTTQGLNPEIYDTFVRKLVFVGTFVGSCPEAEYPANVKSFCASVRVRMYALPLWAPFAKLDMPSGLADSLTECIEIWCSTQLYSVLVFRNPADLERDKALFDQLSSLAFVTPEHLEIPEASWRSREWNAAVTQASDVLFQIPKFKTPLQKLMIIHRTVQLIVDYTSKEKDGGGADVLLPMLVWVLIIANPPQLYTSIKFITDFRNRNYKGTQLEYNLVSVHSALEFVENLQPTDLKGIVAEDFEALKAKSLKGEIKRWRPPVDDPLADFIASRKPSGPRTAGTPSANDDWVMMNEPSRPLFLWCPQMYPIGNLVEHLRFVYNSSSRLILCGSEEVMAALPEIAFGAKAAGIMLIVVGYKPVDWMQNRKVRSQDPFSMAEQLVENFAAEKQVQTFERQQLAGMDTPGGVSGAPNWTPSRPLSTELREPPPQVEPTLAPSPSPPQQTVQSPTDEAAPSSASPESHSTALPQQQIVLQPAEPVILGEANSAESSDAK